MYRFFSPSASVSSSVITVRDPAQVHHIRNTLRLGKGAGVLVFDEKERTYEAVIEQCARGAVTLKIMKRKRQRVPGRPRLTIACALPKQAKMDGIVDKLTQLGVDRIIPLKTQRVIVKWSRDKERLRRERWQKIALGACQQSQRESIPSIDEVSVLDSLIRRLDTYDLKLFPTLSEKKRHLAAALTEHHPRNCIVFIGPEGDFSPQETKLALQSGCLPVSLGDRVLRVDTAAIAVASYYSFYAHR